MRAPDFWYGSAGTAAAALAPLGWLYGFAGTLRRAVARPLAVGVPVVCIGNLVAGGAGKTPVALAIAALLAARRPAFLTRGYGGRLRGPVQVDARRHTVAEVGDEALLLAAAAPTFVARDRVAGARLAAKSGAGVIVMDDGFQNPGLRKDLSLIVIDDTTGFGNGRLIPAGPLREPPGPALERAQGVVLVGEDVEGLAGRLPTALPVFGARLVPAPGAEALADRRVYAFAGIGRPAKFFGTLAAMGCDIVAARPFADHHRYREAEIDEIVYEAAARDAMPVTTAKDAVRLPADRRAQIRVLDVVLEWRGEAAIRRFLDERLGYSIGPTTSSGSSRS
jgi:tetraacyldisaccharide 4'-kinase